MVPSSKYGKQFRRRFRLPWQAFKDIVNLHREEHDFHEGRDAVGRPCVPLELKILGVLRVLGRGYTFDDVAEFVVSGEEIHRVFFYKFIEVYASKYVDLWVTAPKTSAELLEKTTEYREAKLDGCAGLPQTSSNPPLHTINVPRLFDYFYFDIGSTDVVHIWHCNNPACLKHSYHGKLLLPLTLTLILTLTLTRIILTINTGKEKLSTVAFEVVGTHRREVISVSPGFPGAVNDKTIIRFDSLTAKIRQGVYSCRIYFILSYISKILYVYIH